MRGAAATIDVVHGLAAEYATDAGDASREVKRVEDPYDDTTGMPR